MQCNSNCGLPDSTTELNDSCWCRHPEYLALTRRACEDRQVATHLNRPTLHPQGFKHSVELPYGLRVAEVKAAIDEMYDFFYNVNGFLVGKGWERLEEMLQAAALSGLISELFVSAVSKQSTALVKNKWHNGRPDLIPTGHYAEDRCQRGDEGIEVKASKRDGNWQGHNKEEGWLMLCQYSSDIDSEPEEVRQPLKVVRVLCAYLDEDDWSFSGRKEGSRRTPTATISKAKLVAGVVYADPDVFRDAGPKKTVPIEVVAQEEE
jgi:hypothetical protein